MKIHPEDLERALGREPEVRESAVVAVDGPQGPEPLAVLILRRREADAAAVIERANRSLAGHQRMRRWYVWPEEDFPRTPTRKVRRGIVREIAMAALDGRARSAAEGAPTAAESSAVDRIVSRIGAGARGTGDSSATLGTDLKLDSLGRIELLGALEDRYEVDLDEAALTEETTLGDVERMIRLRAEAAIARYPYPRWQSHAPLGWVRIALLYALVQPFTRILGRPRVGGAERLRGIRGPVVFVCNHVTMVDHALVLSAVSGRFKRTMAIAMDGEVLRELRYPAPGTGLSRRILGALEYASVVFFFNVFSMPRKSGFRRSFEFAGEMIDRGASVLVFPEGAYTTTGAIDRFMPGTGLLVAGLGVPIVPMRIDGLWELKRARRRRASPGEISIAIGEPVTYSRRETPERIAADLEVRVRRLRSD
jgi:long-chain acyl-CoA synthetase